MDADVADQPPGTAAAAGQPPGPPAPAVRPQVKIWLERDGQVVLSAWRVELLAAIEETGSLARAAEKLDVPYRTAWYKLKELETRLGLKLLETQSGGAEGGGSRLTAAARDLVQRFQRASAGVGELVEHRFRAEFGELLG